MLTVHSAKIQEPAMMLRWATLILFAIASTGAAFGADKIVTRHAKRHVVERLPPGLPRAHYKYRTTITYGAPAPVYVERDPDLLFTPTDGPGGYIQNLPGTPLLPGSAALPGYYGRAFSYDYQGPYYGGPYVGYWDRLPYACGVYGYC
jgi:hypothetical protein